MDCIMKNHIFQIFSRDILRPEIYLQIRKSKKKVTKNIITVGNSSN